jgi:hypothetical protein
VAVEYGHSFDLIRQLVSALNSHERDRQLGRLQARKSTDLRK